MKKTLLLGMLSVSAAALAVFAAVGSSGQGVAESRDGRVGKFDFHVAKGDGGALRGQLRFEQVANAHGRRIVIELSHLGGLQVDGRNCHFRGGGVFVTTDGQGHTVRRQGVVAVAVADLRNHEHPEGRDRFEIRFEGREHHFSYGFAGLVTHGDLVVFSH